MDRLRHIRERFGGAGLLVIGFALFCAVYEYGRVMQLPPTPYHGWRMADCLSLTTHFHNGEGRFLAPVMHARLGDDGTTGRTAGELPLLYWCVAQVWKITGPSELVYRVIGLLLHFIGTLALFLALRRWLQSTFWSLGIALLFFTSPVVVYYTIGFLTDVPAFDLAMIGMYGTVRFAQVGRRRWWVLAMVAFALAVGLKVTAGMGLLALLGLYFVVTVMPGTFSPWRPIFPRPLFGWSTALLALLPVVAWYIHAEGINRAHNGRYTFNSLWPIWEMSSAEIEAAQDFARDLLWFQVFDTSVWALVALALVSLAVNMRRLPLPMRLLLVALLVGLVLYVLAWFHAVDGHDYYFINPLIVPLVVLACWLWWLRRDHPDLFHARWARWAFAALLIYNVAYAANNHTLRTNPYSVLDRKDVLPLYHSEELRFFNALYWGPLNELIGIRDELVPAGILQDDLVYIPLDQSINASLYFMDRPGHTRYAFPLEEAATLEQMRGRGVAWMVLSEELERTHAWLQPYLGVPAWSRGDVRIHALRSLPLIDTTVVLLDRDRAIAMTLSEHLDTIPCADPHPWRCFSDAQEPYALFDLPVHAAGAVYAEVTVVGRAEWTRGRPRGSRMHIWQQDPQGGKFTSHRLPEGDFQLTFRIDPRRSPQGCKLYVDNDSGRPFRVRMDRLEVRRVWPLTAPAEESGVHIP